MKTLDELFREKKSIHSRQDYFKIYGVKKEKEMKLVRWLAFVTAIGTTALFVVFWEFWVKKQDTTDQ